MKRISDLKTSRSFRTTHAAIADLRCYLGRFSDDDIDRFCLADVVNDQVRGIIADLDVTNFYGRLFDADVEINEPLGFDQLFEL